MNLDAASRQFPPLLSVAATEAQTAMGAMATTWVSGSHWFALYGMDPGAEHEVEFTVDAHTLVTVVAVPTEFVPEFEPPSPPSPLPPVPVLAGQQMVGASPPFRELTVVNFRMGWYSGDPDDFFPRTPIVRFTVRNTGTLKLYSYDLTFSYVWASA